MILEDDEANAPSIEVASTAVDAGSDLTTKLNNPTDPLSQDTWYDVEYGCYVLEDCVPPPAEEDGLAPTIA